MKYFTLEKLKKIIKKEYSVLNDYVKFFKIDENKMYYFIGENKDDFQTVYFLIEKKDEDQYELKNIMYYNY